MVQIWQTHPFRKGNTRSVIIFAALLAKSLGFEVKQELFQEHAAYVRNAFVLASQGIYSNYEYLEQIFFDAILGDDKLAILDNLVGIIPAQEAADKNTIKEEWLTRKWVE